ncbi:ABC transporter substrate-binding protein [Bradyrhizobium lablabi]|uniref:ABC transporter substrate-binding protein n=1 Tax=Bradyrhizobium lablabi TaxID=722472 RepID=UPI001BADB866|nr:ABC transporter substrate-binding protein [Bradyrhizobium lablabi]MBR1120658.1 ABC transporter substrate-binding protein [Bradyrhizobium lablabi]
MHRRREFITFLAGTAVAWPLAVFAQQRTAPVVGFLGTGLDARRHWLAAFRAGLGGEGFVDGQNVRLEYRSADGGAEEWPQLADDLVRREAAVIAASGPTAALAAKRATSTIPIVFLSGADPVHMGLVSSFHRPNGNITGFYFPVTELPAKRLALLHELLPVAKRIAVLVNPAVAATAEPTVRGVVVAGHALSLDVEIFNATTSTEIDAAFAALSKWRPDALLVGSDPFFITARAQLVALAARHAFPAIYFQRDYVEAGGLMSYGPDYADSYRQAGVYVGRILKGTKPVELPVQQSTKVELVINLKTAKALALEVPPNLLARADEAIE